MFSSITDADDPLIRLLYHSRASAEVRAKPDPYMREILGVAVSRNAEVEVTGALLYCDGWFIQGLEGIRSRVGHVFGRISSDRRHGAVTQISASPIERRDFSAWSMCGATLAPMDAAIVGLLESKDFQPNKQTSASILKLLKTVVSIKDREGVLFI